MRVQAEGGEYSRRALRQSEHATGRRLRRSNGTMDRDRLEPFRRAGRAFSALTVVPGRLPEQIDVYVNVIQDYGNVAAAGAR